MKAEPDHRAPALDEPAQRALHRPFERGEIAHGRRGG
jgi:hypothetical protein